MPLEQPPRTALSSPNPHLDPASYAHLAARQSAEAFNQPLSLDTSKVTTMYYMFAVRALAPTSCQTLPCNAACAVACAVAPAHRPLTSRPAPLALAS